VPEGLAPAALPSVYRPDPLITIQPVGVTFATPVPITFANVDQLAAQSQVDIYSLSPFTGQFSAVGTGEVSADGQRIETINGGILAADWHFNLPPSARGGFAGGAGYCPADTGSSTSLQSGALTVEHTTPDYVSQGLSRAVRLVYSSDQAAPRPVITTETTLLALGAVPPAVSIDSLTVGGVAVGGEIFTDTSGLSESLDETFRQVTSFDASGLTTGAYRAVVGLTSHYPRSAIQALAADEIVINNQRSNPIGAGWTIDGLARLHIQADGTVVLVDGDRPARNFGRGTVTADLAVDGRTNIFAAGKTSPPGGGLFPPLVELDGVDIEVTFPNVTGLVSGWTAGCAFNGPDGGLGCGGGVTDVASSGGISGMIYNGGTMFLAGVFIDDEVPSDPAPPRIDFTDIANTELDVFPELAQTFFVGDGRTTAGELQRFHAPSGATRLYLGFIETQGFSSGGPPGAYADNGGVLDARVEYSAGSGSLPREFETPSGVFAALRQNQDGSFTLTQPDGTASHFDSGGLQTSRADPNGNTTSWTYDVSGRVLSMTDPVGKITSFGYAGGRLATITDPFGRVTALSHDASGDVIEIASPDGSTRRFTYDASHRMTSQVDERGFTTAYEFNTFGHHIRTVRPDNSILAIGAANAAGLPDPGSGVGTPSNPSPLVRVDEVFASIAEPEVPPVTFGVDSRSFVDRATDPAGFTTSAVINDDGLAEGISFPSGNSVTSGYDEVGNLVSHARGLATSRSTR
jgi:YD repeat-containing protein